MGDVPVITLDPYLLGIQGVLSALQAAGLLPDLDPIDYIISLFDGKPKEEDTAIAAALLQASTWWPLQALGRNLEIWVRNGVPLSTGKAPLRAQLSDWIRGTIETLEPLVFQRADPLKLDTLIWKVLASQTGPQGLALIDGYLDSLKKLGPLPQLPTPQQPPTAPPGPPWQIIPPTTIGGAPCVASDPDTDEILDNCNAAQAALQTIIIELWMLTNKEAGPNAAQCCANIVAAIKSLNSTLINIWTSIETISSAGHQPPPDLTAIVQALNNIATGLEPFLARIATALDGPVALAPLPDMTPPPPPKSRAGIADAVLKQMVTDGRLNASYGQLITS